jgi:tyrosyl-tRNA synthetase
MDITTRLELIKQVGEEIVTEEELKVLLESSKPLTAYDGFEPSGVIHIAQAVMRAINVNRMTKAGVRFKMLVADWHAMANDKMGGDLERIQKVGHYFIEVWKACGMDLDKVDFVWANDLVADRDYWKRVVQIGRSATVKRIIRCGQIMGRKEDDSMSAAQIVYPLMQCADIFHLKADICQLGMDQRKVNMLAREIGPELKLWKPVVVSHHMLMGLTEPPKTEDALERAMAMKMSKSRPDTAIFMTDSAEDIDRKIKKAYCPIKQVEENPMMEYCKYLIFGKHAEMKIERDPKFGGDLIFGSYEELAKAYAAEELHPADLKKAVAIYINEMIEPVRKHFATDHRAHALQEYVLAQKVTR